MLPAARFLKPVRYYVRLSPQQRALEAECEYHERLYSGSAQAIFARPAVRAFRAHLVSRILQKTGAAGDSRVLSIGCGIGDTELLLAPHVGHITGIDISQKAVEQARNDAVRMKIRNAEFIQGHLEEVPRGQFDLVIAIFFLHHLPDPELEALPRQVAKLLVPGGVFYSLDPSRLRLSGALGSILIPWIVRRYQSPGERRLGAARTARYFADAGYRAEWDMYDFGSTPMAGLFPGWRGGYTISRRIDDVLVKTPLLRTFSSNFEIVARRPA